MSAPGGIPTLAGTSGRLLPRIGAHVSSAGALGEVLPRARRIGAEVVQIFPSNPRQWRGVRRSREEVQGFGEALHRSQVPLFVHAIYLVNLASPDPELRSRSAAALADALWFGAVGGASAVVTHVGSHRGEGFAVGLDRVVETVSRAREMALAAVGAGNPEIGLPPLLLETSAGGGESMGREPEELAELLRALPRRTGLCLDTAHLFASGVPIHTPEGLDGLLGQIGRSVGVDRVGLVHLNDSQSPFGSRHDRHENLWEGEIGRRGLEPWLSHATLLHVPFVLEVPGFGKRGPDRRNISRGRRMRRSVASSG